MNIFKKLFTRKPKLTGRQINMWEHKGWGDSINWLDFNRRRMSGHMQNQPEKGDIINCEMTSGKVFQFLVIEKERCSDPRDMFFCSVSDFGYTDSIKP